MADILRNNVKEKLARGEVAVSMTVRLVRTMGLAGQYDHPKVREIYSQVIEACRKQGKHCGVGGLASRPDLIAEYVRMGARYVSSGTDLAFLLGAAA